MTANLPPIECAVDQMEVIVLDNGSGSMKYGFCGEDMPRGVQASVLANVKVETKEEDGQLDTTSALKPREVMGDEALKYDSETAELRYALDRGLLREDSIDTLESFWEFALSKLLQGESEDLKVLLCDSPAVSTKGMQKQREEMAKLMFEKFKVASLAIMNSAVLSLFSTGRSRGLVLEMGHGSTHAVPVFESYSIPHGTFGMDVGGADVTDELTRVFQGCPQYGAYENAVSKIQADNAKKKNEEDKTFFSLNSTMSQLKESLCHVAPMSLAHQLQQPDPADEEHRSFELPDGTIIQLDQDVRYTPPETLFKGEESLQSICKQAIETCDMDFRTDLVRSVVLAGGNAMLPGLAARVRLELSRILSPDLVRQMEIVADPHRKYSAWIGGSMVASFSTFQQLFISKSEFEEQKADLSSLVARKSW
uniref:Actin n=1 Tax=Chromera velia CCMP2878 TaxID=1169474 RepID=A0A0G4I0M6_9ALVE|eukprot:Cvel_9953.t1-p1 / transcript=Cvel_9953.t1 / gene=Cvel_9953 / organism=Chromera_velia_CCMP2878 / gene_product=Actin, cytoskeletal 2B, putative / transcript_product=Actin, cytoskeletal 2B, putative / location=Cvel_scaffold589:43535-44800(-) / protein_length=422 / sequence_SO=supercontig / SO=protein_coding / is_pseudo=false